MEGNMEKKSAKKVVQLSDFTIQTILGSGSFGKVKLIKRKNDGAVFCIKTMKKAVLIELQQADHILNEVDILSQIKHPMIVGFEGISQDHKFLHLVLQYVPGGELFSHLREEESFPPLKCTFYASQIVLIFDYLHKKNIIYRDLKPENILIARDGYLKLADFGFAKKIQNRTFTFCGTPEYLAPEILLNQGHGKPVDWWTLGILIYEMIAGIDPFSDKDPMAIYQNILKGRLRFPKAFDPKAKSLVKHLLASDLSKRYGNLKNGVDDIKIHRFFSQISLSNILAKKIVAPYMPSLKSDDDTANFQTYDDSNSEVESVGKERDPFMAYF